MDKRTEGRALAAQIKSFVSGEIDRRTSEVEPPEIKLTSYATVDTTAIGEALRSLAPIIAESVNAGDEIRASIAAAVAGWARDDAALAKAIEGRELDIMPIVDAIAAIRMPDHSRELLQLAKEIAAMTAATDQQTAAIKDQTKRLEAAARLSKTVTYDAAGRVKTIKVG